MKTKGRTNTANLAPGHHIKSATSSLHGPNTPIYSRSIMTKQQYLKEQPVKMRQIQSQPRCVPKTIDLSNK